MSDQKEFIRRQLQEARTLLLEAVTGLDDDMAVASTENPEWRVRDILAHLAASEPGLLHNINRFLAEEELPSGFDLDRWNRRQVAKQSATTVEDLLLALQTSRKQALAMLDSLSEDDLAVTGTHPAGFDTTVAGIFLTIANHELDHGNEIRTALGLPVIKQADWKQAMST